MNWGQFKDPVSHMCIASTVVVCWSLTQEVVGLGPFIVITNFFVTEFEFSERFRKNSILWLAQSSRHQTGSQVGPGSILTFMLNIFFFSLRKPLLSTLPTIRGHEVLCKQMPRRKRSKMKKG